MANERIVEHSFVISSHCAWPNIVLCGTSNCRDACFGWSGGMGCD